MNKHRLEAFSDGVLAIILTIMVLEMKIPHRGAFADLRPVLPFLSSYALSFVMVGIYWNNHHHMLHAVHKVNGGILWANMHLLFWLSLVPFTTGWMAENGFAARPVALYGGVLLAAGAAFYALSRALIRHHGPESLLARAVGEDPKGMASLALYAGAVPLAFLSPKASLAIYVAVALMWLVPDRRIERELGN